MAVKRKGLGSFFVELIIVFIGVYGAFELNRYQQEKRDHAIKKNYIQSFQSELVTIRGQVTDLKARVESRIKSFTTALEQGEQPSPIPINLYLSSSLLITQAGLNEDIFIQLSPSLASSLSGGYDNVRLVTQRITDFNDLCNRQLIRNTSIDFYDRQGNLRPEFNWYMQGLREINAYLDSILTMINEGAMPATEALLEEMR